MSEPSLAQVVARLAAERPAAFVQQLHGIVGRHDEPSPRARSELESASPLPELRSEAETLYRAWDQSGLPGVAVALAFDAASLAGSGHDEVEVVWTGPTAGAPPVRQSLAVLLDLIRSARGRLTVFSFAAYKVAVVVDALRAAAERGVDVRIVLDENASPGAIAEIVGEFAQVYRWPEAYLLPNGKANASMHVKGALADDQAALVTSANLTEHALGKNMELGLLVRGGSVPRQLAQHFDWLIASGVLEAV